MELKRELGLDSLQGERSPEGGVVQDTFWIRDIYLKGISEKDQDWIRKIIRLKDNRLMTRKEIHQVITRLYGTKLFSGVTYRLLGGPVYDLELNLQQREMSELSLGVRFDSEEMAAILLNTRLNFRAMKGSRFELTARLSKSPFVRLDYSFENPFWHKLNLTYMFKYNDFGLYAGGDKINGTTCRYHKGEVSLTDFYIRNFKFQWGCGMSILIMMISWFGRRDNI